MDKKIKDYRATKQAKSGYKIPEAIVDGTNLSKIELEIDTDVEKAGVSFEEGKLTFGIPKPADGKDGKDGKDGQDGASAVFDPETGNILATLESTTGQSTANAMTQKAVTDAIKPLNELRHNNFVGKERLLIAPTEAGTGKVYRETLGNTSNRLRVLAAVKAGTKIAIQSSMGVGLVVYAYTTLIDAIKSSTQSTIVVQVIADEYTTNVVNATIEQDCIICATLKKNNGSVFTSTEIAQYISNVQFSAIPPVGENVDSILTNFENGIVVPYNTGNSAANYCDINSNTYNRIRVIYKVSRGNVVSGQCTLGKGAAIAVFSTLFYALEMLTNSEGLLDNITDITTSSFSHVVKKDGYMAITLCKSDSSNFSEAEIETYVNALDIRIDRHNKQVFTGTDLFIGKLVNKAYTASGLGSDSTTRATSYDCLAVPYVGCTINITTPDDIYFGIRSGNKAENLSTHNYWLSNGDTFTFSNDARYYRLSFAKGWNGQNDTINAADVMDMIARRDIRLTYTKEYNLIDGETEKYAKAVKHLISNNIADNHSLDELPTFAHTSDLHGDATRFRRFLKFCDYIHVDAALVSGDMVAVNPSNNMDYINTLADSYDTQVLLCVGNHDAQNSTVQEQYNSVMAHLIDKNNSVVNSEEDYPTYYYQDYTSKKIRVISLNLYDLSHQGDQYGFSGGQCEWLVNALNSTPADYGILLIYHGPESTPTLVEGKDAFRQSVLKFTLGHADLSLTGRPISKIIDAFIGREVVSLTYTSSGVTYSIDADFSNVPESVEFIAHVNGHWHTDTIGYMADTTHRQLVLNVCCTIPLYGTTYPYLANMSDMPRGEDATQDCFNLYSIDRVHKQVRMCKIGSNVTSALTERKFMTIDY